MTSSMLLYRVKENIIPIIFILTFGALSVSISASQIGLGLMLLFVIYYIIKGKIKLFSDNPYFIFIFFFWLATLMSLIFGSERLEISGNLFGPWYMLIFITAYYFSKEKIFHPAIFFSTLCSIALALSAIYEYFFLGIARGNGFLKGYMMTAHILSVSASLIFAYVLFCMKKNILNILYYITAILIILLGIYTTGTRMPLIAVSISFMIILIFKYKYTGIVFALLIIAGNIVIFNSPAIESRFYELTFGLFDAETSHGWRLLLWSNAYELFKQFPFFGTGGGVFESYMNEMMPKDIDLPKGHAHNGYIMMITTYGIAGFLIFITFVVKILKDAINMILLKSKEAYIIIAVSITFFIEAVTENNIGLSLTCMQYLFITGFILGLSKRERKEV